MNVSHTFARLLVEAPLSKAEWSRRSGISRALIDDYLKRHKQPSVAQVDRLVAAAGYQVDLQILPRPTPAPTALDDVLGLGELFEPISADPLPDLSPVWRSRPHG